MNEIATPVSRLLEECSGGSFETPRIPRHDLSISVSFFLSFFHWLLGDQIAGMLAVAVASSRTLEVLDLEGTGLTNQSAQVNRTFGGCMNKAFMQLGNAFLQDVIFLK